MRTLVILVIIGLSSTTNASSKREQLLESNALFDKGQYKKALNALANINVRTDFDSSDDMKLALKIRAIAYEETGDRPHARESIRELFFLEPTYVFDPFDTPQAVVTLAQQEKLAIEEKNKRLATIKSETENAKEMPAIETAASPPEEKIVFIERRPSAVTTLFPLGINHFYLRSPVKGSIYLSLQTLGLAANITAFWWKQSYLDSFGSRQLKDPSYRDRFYTIQIIQYVGLGTWIASFAISVVDALITLNNMPTQTISAAN